MRLHWDQILVLWKWCKKDRRTSTSVTVCIGVMLITVLVIAIRVDRWADWTGLGRKESISTTLTERDSRGNIVKTITKASKPGKTLWDWFGLLGVPVSLAILGYVFQRQQQKLADDKAREELLQVYFDRLSVLLIDKNLLAIAAKVHALDGKETRIQSEEGVTPEQRELLDTSVDVIRARTLSILRRFTADPKRKGSVICFLIEAEIISKAKLDLSTADVSEVNLGDADLSEANLSKANLSNAKLVFSNLKFANLSKANLERGCFGHANLSGANLVDANLNGAILFVANLSGANLSGANLSGANLSGANLSDADLSDADFSGANLSEANLSGANLSESNLSESNLSGANLSDAVLSDAVLSNANLSDVIILGTDLRSTKGLTQQQLEGETPPLFCNAPLPVWLDIEDSKYRNCEVVKAALTERYRFRSQPFEEVEAYVEKQRQKTWE